MYIDNALNLAYSYAEKICNQAELDLVSDELIKIAGKTDEYTFRKDDMKYSYSETQNMLSKLNEKESIRKSKGVYYTPCDVVHFIVVNSIKSAYGKLKPNNIGQEDLSDIPYKSFATRKTVFDPTCGSGEYLLVALEMKIDALSRHYKKIPLHMVHEAVRTIFGNDINEESIAIAKIRILLCILRKVGAYAIDGLANITNPNFYSYDYIVSETKGITYDIIVGNPPYVEDFKSGLQLSKKYGNIYANVLINATNQLYLVEKSKANRFMYETVRGGKISGTHAYYTLDSAATGRYALQNDTEEYVVSYSDGRQDSELIPLSGFRNHGFNPSLSELGVQHNTVNIMSAVHILVSRYLELYQTNISLIMGTDPEYTELYQLSIMLERS